MNDLIMRKMLLRTTAYTWKDKEGFECDKTPKELYASNIGHVHD